MNAWRFSFSAILVLLAGCAGSQQSLPQQGLGTLPAGFLRVTFHVAGPLDFAKYQYDVVFNTSGNGLTPEFGQKKAQWAAYSDAIKTIVAKSGPAAEIIQYVPNSKDPHVPPTQVVLAVTPAQFQFNANTNGNAQAFTVTFERSILGANSMKLADDWLFNAATYNARGVVDSMGSCDDCFKSPALPVHTAFDRTIDAVRSTGPAAARIVDVQFSNQP